MIDIKKLMEWSGLRQAEFSVKAGIDQGGLSKIINGLAAPSTKLQERIIERFTPSVTFIAYSKNAACAASAMLASNKIDALEHEPDAFNAALKKGLNIGVICENKSPFIKLIEQSLMISGLPKIECRAIINSSESEWREWIDFLPSLKEGDS